MKKIIIMSLTIVWMLTFSVSAQDAFTSYVYDINGKAVASPDAVTLSAVYTGEAMGTTALSKASDLCVGPDGRLYIVDTGNNRILILNAKMAVDRVLSGFTDQTGKWQTFASPQGLFVHKDGSLYIADTDHHRIVVLNADGKLRMLVGTPVSTVLTAGFVFKPTKLAVDTADRIFVTSSGFNMGLLQLDKNGKFVKCLGAPNVTYTASEYFWRLFSTKEQIARSISFVPTEYNNIAIDDENFLFVTSSSYDLWEYMDGGIKPLRRLNALGNDILRRNGSVNPYGDTMTVQVGSYRGPSTLVDVTTMGHGMYAILDANRSRVFVYNSDGDILFMFGGPGALKGAFKTPSALVFSDNSYYILDSAKQTLTKYSLNDYGQMLYNATVYHDQSKYDLEQEIWKTIARNNINHPTALIGIGKAAYRSKNYTEAMRLFKLADDKTNYSKAYQKYRAIFVAQYFGWMMLGLALILAAWVIVHMIRKRNGITVPELRSYRGTLRFSRQIMFHPLEASWDMKREKRGSLAAAMTLLGLCCVAVALYDCYSGFIFCMIDARDSNVLLEAVKVLAPFLLFCICNWCVTSLIGGEGKFTDIVMAASYSLTPLVIFLPIATVLSHVLTSEERDFYIVFVVIAALWAAILLICSNKQIHNYSMSRALGVLLLTLLTMLIVVFLMVLAFVLIQQFIGFIQDIANELYLRS